MLLCTLPAASPPALAQKLGDQLPQSWGGLPPDTPARPATVAPTPPVYDVPPPRPSPPLTESQQRDLERELSAIRARQGKLKDPGAAQRAEDANAAATEAIERARKKAGNPAPKTAPPTKR